MVYSQISPKAEMLQGSMLRRPQGSMMPALRFIALGSITVFALQGCATYNPVTVFHNLEGGDPAKKPPPAPGLDDPPPNLASVPPRPPMVSPGEQAVLLGRLQAANHSQNALAAPAGGVPAIATPVAAPRPESPPLLIGFQPGKAIVGYRDRRALVSLAAQRGAARIVAIGFAPSRTPADLHLAIMRATAIADVLTQAGVPGRTIRIEALTAGRGGAAQLLYPLESKQMTPTPTPSQPKTSP